MIDACGNLHYQNGVLRYTGVKEAHNFARVSYFTCASNFKTNISSLKISLKNKSYYSL